MFWCTTLSLDQSDRSYCGTISSNTAFLCSTALLCAVVLYTQLCPMSSCLIDVKKNKEQ